jgi:heme/copper-type cytochrome/quinol oxidase subunit 4
LLSFLRSLQKTLGLLTTIVLTVVAVVVVAAVVSSNKSILTELLGVAQDPKVVLILGCLKC